MYDHQNLSYGVQKDRKLSQKHENSYSNWYNHHQEAMESHHSGATSPKKSPSPSHPLLRQHNYRSLSPESRAEAIVRGQWELMEMVRNMPESSYELSLKDIVEHHRVETTQSPPQTAGVVDSVGKNLSLQQRAVVKVKREDQSKKIERNLSFENKGLFLNMVFPFSFKSKKNNKVASNNSVRVSPKPEGLKGGGEREWWKKKFTGSSDSDRSRTSNNSGSSGTSGGSGAHSRRRSDVGGRKTNGFLSGCWPFFHSRSSKSAE